MTVRNGDTIAPGSEDMDDIDLVHSMTSHPGLRARCGEVLGISAAQAAVGS